MRTGSWLEHHLNLHAPLRRGLKLAISGIVIMMACWINVAQAMSGVEITQSSFVYHSQGESEPRVIEGQVREINEAKKQVTALALKYHLVSQHTSLVAVEVIAAKPSSVVSNNASAVQSTSFGWQPPVGYLPQTGGESRLLIMMGMILLGLGLAYLASFSFDRGAGLSLLRNLAAQKRRPKVLIKTGGEDGDDGHGSAKGLEA
ncbi:LPXTG cell wall anchor domain-containing protein [Shewanella sp.]|uniref:LPXTG cell wall anchor domain-containing protein n=1 Tax=Shewanella sp. TaxID=50422 RepID=UPI001ECF06F0|nr:LPXTG cell wall anchor domain-containing protein [Shewanella sp.]NRB22470.1 LPXTG cell wall anchor domain-containing protein [Shewanella sp.]